MCLELLDHAADCRQPGAEQSPRLRLLRPAPASSAFRIFSSLFWPSPERSRSLPSSAAVFRLVERGDSELGPDPGGRLRADAGQPQEVDHAHGDALAPPGERVHLPVVDDLDDLLLDRLADAGQLGRATRERQLGDRRRRLPDARGRAAVGDDLERLLREDLRDVREQVELVGDLRVPGQRLGHAAMIWHVPRAVVCLPTYNERENLEAMVRALGEVLDTSRDGVLVIDDGSPDGTGEIADRLAERAALGLGAASRAEGGDRARVHRRLPSPARERHRARARDGLRLLARPGRRAAADRGGERRRPRARLALRQGRRDGELGAPPTRRLARRLHLRAGAPRRARARPDGRLQVLPPGDARGDRPRTRSPRTATRSRSRRRTACSGRGCGCRRSRSASSSAAPGRRR